MKAPTEKNFFSRPEIQRFLIRFFAFFIGVEIYLYLFPPLAYQEWLAQSVASWFHAPFHEVWISVINGRFEITPSCTGLTSVSLFLGLLIGFPRIPKNKAVAGIAGLVLILLLNYLRLVLIIGVGEQFSLEAADLIHTLSWFVLSGIAFGFWYYLIRKETRANGMRGVGKALLERARTN